MRKYLSIVIPRYKEDEKNVFPLLSSINGQLGIDFDDIEVIIANDGGGAGPLRDEFLSMFGFDIRQVNLPENRGPGVARQYGLDDATGDYVMFCDADDTLHNVGVLGSMIEECTKYVPDMLTTSWLEELYNEETKRKRYLNHEKENTWMHGKFIRRAFLDTHNIRFKEDLRVHEDSYFLSIISAMSKNRRYLPITSYVWKFSSDSITRRNHGEYTFTAMPTFIYACMSANEVVEQFDPSLMEWRIIQFTLYNYFTYHMSNWLTPAAEKYRQESEEAFVKYITPFWHYWVDAKPVEIQKQYTPERNRIFTGNIENETLSAWIERIGLEQNKG